MSGRSESEYWNPKNETLPRGDLERLQVAKLRRRLEWAQARSPFHRRKLEQAGVGPDDVRSLADLERIPFTTREEWMASIVERPLFGDLLTRPPEQAVRSHLTSGTSGRTPLRVLDGMKDWQWIAELWCYGFWGFGVRPADTVFFAFSYGSFIGFWGAHYACEKMGCLVIPSGNMTTENRVRQIVEMGATVLCSTPTYALRLAQTAAELGIDLGRESKVRRIILSGEPAGSIPASRRLIEQAWGAACGDTAGMTELGTICIFECRHQPGGTHIIEDHYIEEVIDPKSLRPVGYGEKGERVVTSFGRDFIPVLRYRTADMVERVEARSCPCGRTFDLYRGGIQGRWDDMRKIRGTNVYPRAVEAIVREYREIDEFQLVFHRKGDVDEVTVRAELRAGCSDWEGLAPRLAADLAAAHEGLRINVEQAPAGSLPRFELKAKRFIDTRGQA